MTATFYVGDAIEVMNRLPESSVDLILSSPPFLALRSYLPADHPDKLLEGGSQATPGEYIDWLLDVVETADRILAPHGSLCFELGDTYAGSGGGGGDYYEDGLRAEQPGFTGSAEASRDSLREANAVHWRQKNGRRNDGSVNLQHGVSKETGGRLQNGTGWPLAKSLSLIPESFRFAMVYGVNSHTGRQTERWRLRNVIRWVRPNPPVGALGDKFRPATSELMVFCKSAKRYFDLDAVREPSNWPGAQYRPDEPDSGVPRNAPRKRGGFIEGNPVGAPPLDWWNIPPGGYPGAHYAVWPPELLVKPIKAMCPVKVCRTCGAPSRRITEVEYEPNRKTNGPQSIERKWIEGGSAGFEVRADRRSTTTGFTDCGHDDYRPGLVLDPFAGTGTTGAVAVGHGRDAILIDLDERNYALALDRVGPLLLTLGVLGGVGGG